MADDKPDSPQSTAGAGRSRRRPAPTIDLTATEVASVAPADTTVGSEPGPAPAEAAVTPEVTDTPSPEPAPETTASAESAASADTAATAGEPSSTDTSASADATAGSAAAAEGEREPAAELPPPSTAGGRVWPMLGAAVGGGAIVVIAMLLLWGIPPRGGEATQQAAQLAALQISVRELANRVPAATADADTTAALAELIGKLEAAAKTSPSPATGTAAAEKIAETENQLAALTRELAGLKQRAEANAAAVAAAQRAAATATAKAESVQVAGAQGAAVDRRELTALADRVTKMESAAQALQAEIARQKNALTQQQAALAKQADNQRNERAVRLAVVAEALKATVARGERFRRELHAAKALAPDKQQLTPLETFADSGVPTASALGQQLLAVLPTMRRAAAPKAATGGSFLDRLQINAERLVRIQPLEERRGDDAAAILTRIDAKARRGDIDGTLAELKTLPPVVRAPAENWIKTAQAREAAIEASRRFAAAHVGALAGRTE